MTVQDLLILAVDAIDDSAKITTYYTDNFGKVTMVITELVKKGIGVHTKEYKVTPGTPAYTPTDTTMQPIALPTDLTSNEQIEFVDVGEYTYTETNSGSLYLLVPEWYTDEITVLYKPLVTAFTAITDTLPISDDAARTVAVYGLAEKLSIANAEEYLDYYASKYEKAKREWIGKDFNPRQIRDVYGF
jgi:hypothetical protein